MSERQDVIPALPERWQCKGDNGETVVKIVSHSPSSHCLFQVAVRRGDNSRMNVNLLQPPQMANLMLLQRSQELNLEERGHLADLIQEYGPSRRELKNSNPRLRGAGKGPRLVPEEFALKEVRWNSGAVDSDEWLIAPFTVVMDVASEDLFTSTALSKDKD